MTKISQFLKNYKALIFVALILMFFQTLGTLYIPTLMSDIVNNGIAKSDLNYVYASGGKMLLTALMTACIAITGAWIASTLASRWGRDIRTTLFAKVQSFSAHDFNRFGTASMITRSTNDIALLQDALALFMQLILPAPIITIGALILAFSKDWAMALMILGTTVLFVVIAIFICMRAVPLYQKLRIGMDEINRILRERITGVRVIRAFNKEGHERTRANEAFSNYAGTSIRVNKIFAVMMPLVLIIINLCSLAIILFGGVRVTDGFIQIGDIMAMIEYALLIFWNLVMGIMMLTMLPKAQTCAARINEVLAAKTEIDDGNGSFPTAESAVPALEFRGVTFQYYHAEEPVLSGLNFSCPIGKTTAIIGGTGSGKSTIASLIMRFYDIQKGSVLINGVDIRNVPQKALRDKVGFVPQKAFLFSGTIASNLRYGNSNATMAELERAAGIAQAAEFIADTDKGYDSFVAQGGTNYSGGQRQRLCIARALTRKTPLYVFDDSFSALDFKTDAKLRAALKENIHDAAIIVVAQRVSSIIDADNIIVLDSGSIAGTGTHEELLESCAIYKEIVKSQMKEVS